MGVQALRPEAAIESFNERIISGFARPGEVQCHPMSIRPQIKIPANELRALVDPDRLRISDLAAYAAPAFERHPHRGS